jgi:hypothetical protein
LNHSKGASKKDVSFLNKKQIAHSLLIDGNTFSSKFTIGIEIEKNSFHRNAVTEYPLFCGFERDGSCGYEAVTNILPLIPASLWRTKVFNMFAEANRIIEDSYSPSDYKCGGHITIACSGINGKEVNELVRKYSGIVMALFRKRLKNSYCNKNLRMQKEEDGNHFNGWHYKYQMALVKGDCLEFRVCSKIESVKQLMRRYELFYELVNFAVNVKGSYNVFLNKIKPIILSMYNNDESKTNEIISLSKSFNKFILDGTISDDIREFII